MSRKGSVKDEPKLVVPSSNAVGGVDSGSNYAKRVATEASGGGLTVAFPVAIAGTVRAPPSCPHQQNRKGRAGVVPRPPPPPLSSQLRAAAPNGQGGGFSHSLSTTTPGEIGP
ncbi:hypothetical protein Syun_011645 [Stephania yunnanensis]|uniref:Uncharacterized protein n=1 Tax=Stephania yunnanensis TaxID=152371 RepID=A0AAP0K056_9MAGN